MSYNNDFNDMDPRWKSLFIFYAVLMVVLILLSLPVLILLA